MLSWAVVVAAALSVSILAVIVVLYLPTLTASALFAGLVLAIISTAVVLYLPTWASLSIVGAIVVVAVIGGEALLVKALIIGGLVVLARWLWRRYSPSARRSRA